MRKRAAANRTTRLAAVLNLTLLLGACAGGNDNSRTICEVHGLTMGEIRFPLATAWSAPMPSKDFPNTLSPKDQKSRKRLREGEAVFPTLFSCAACELGNVGNEVWKEGAKGSLNLPQESPGNCSVHEIGMSWVFRKEMENELKIYIEAREDAPNDPIYNSYEKEFEVGLESWAWRSACAKCAGQVSRIALEWLGPY